MELSQTEENYLKTICNLSEGLSSVPTNKIAESLQTKPASVTDMIKRLSEKELVNYVKYKGVTLTDEGRSMALWIIRKHRLWEVFLLEKLNFNWDEVHEVAEQLEHIKSRRMIEELDAFLGFPKFDPHGDPIPDSSGVINDIPQISLSDASKEQWHLVVAVKDGEPSFLRYLDKIKVKLGIRLKVLDYIEFDGSFEIEVEGHAVIIVSAQVAESILVKNVG